ncbi:MAG: DUF6978 family protein [Planctomycetota bacterium]
MTQAEADALIQVEKHRANKEEHLYPGPGDELRVDLVSQDRRERFLLTVNRKTIRVAKRSYQTLARKVIVLVRLDYGQPHTNPDGTRIDGPHLHLYREGYAAKWAKPVPPQEFPNLGDPYRALVVDFMDFCHVTEPPVIRRGLFYMIDEIERLLDAYASWLRDKTTLERLADWVEITTPYLDRHNDHLQIYVRRDNGGFLLTDDSHVISDLRLSGCELDTPKRGELLEQVLNGFGVERQEDALVVQASRSDFASRKHNLVQAMLAVDDLFALAQPVVASLFLEDVTAWLEAHAIRYAAKVKLAGKSGFDHMFDFLIPKSDRRPERLLRALSSPTRSHAESFAFAWVDTRETRPEEARAYALLNDSESRPQGALLDALRRYGISPILWSEREDAREELAA